MKILVTGGSRGIGKEICNKFLLEGHEIIAPSKEDLDLSKPIHKTFEDIDVLINNAGINTIKSIFESDVYEELMRVHYFSPLELIKSCLPHMIASNYGRIVNIGSIWVDFAKPGRSSYSASKNALHSLTKSLTSEYASCNILANTVSPGYIETDMTYRNNTAEEISNIKTQIPMGRLGYANEVASLVYFLSVENSYITGQNIVIDGGYSCSAK